MGNQMEKKEMTTFVVDDTAYKTTLTKKFEEREKYAPENTKISKAFIPGTIREIFKKKGDKVQKNDVVLILEAMKMRNNVLAPETGRIKAIHVKTDQSVPKAELLFEME
jgi:pyruvate carboxylase